MIQIERKLEACNVPGSGVTDGAAAGIRLARICGVLRDARRVSDGRPLPRAQVEKGQGDHRGLLAWRQEDAEVPHSYVSYSQVKETTEDYLLGGRKMPRLPIAMSLIVSFVSGITLLGYPAEVFLFGTQQAAIVVAIAVSVLLLNLFYLPVFYQLQTKSIFEYLERRFDCSVRSLASFIFAFSLLLFIPVVIYVPALAFNQVTGMPLSILAPIICSVCVFYTSIGGLKAVVWSDALQSLFTILSMLAVIFLGCWAEGGLSNVIKIAKDGERIEFFNMDPDLTARNTFWTTVFGTIPIHLNIFATHPGSIQRYTSLPSYRQARMVTIIMFIGVVFMKACSTITGLIIYAKYKDCDPLITRQVPKPGQLLPHFVMEIAGQYTGLAGLFLSGVVSTALSTMSTGLNTLAGTLMEDFLKPALPKDLKDGQINFLLKVIVVVLGIVSTLMVFVVQRLGTILQISLSLQGITAGISVFIFSFGLFVPWASARGVTAGAVAGLVTTSILAFGGHFYTASGAIIFARKITSITECPFNLTSSLYLNTTTFGYPGEGTKVFFSDSVPGIFRLSYLYYSLAGLMVATVVGCAVSLLTGPTQPSTLDPKLVVPQLRNYLKRKQEKSEEYTIVSLKEI